MKIITKEKTENFTLYDSNKDYTEGSNDGMRRGSSYTVKTETHFEFQNERKVAQGYEYDLEVTENNGMGWIRPLSINEAMTDLVKRVDIVYPNLYRNVEVKIEGGKVSLSFEWIRLTTEPMGEIFNSPEEYAESREKKLSFFAKVGNFGKEVISIPLSEVKKEWRGKNIKIEMPQKEFQYSEEEIAAFLKKCSRERKINITQQMAIAAEKHLSKEELKDVFMNAITTQEVLAFQKKYAPAFIDWSKISELDIADIEFAIKQGVWLPVEKVLPLLEVNKEAEGLILSSLNTLFAPCRREEDIKEILRNVKCHSDIECFRLMDINADFYVREFGGLLKWFDFKDAERKDFEKLKSIEKHTSLYFEKLFEVGCIVKADEKELLEILEAAGYYAISLEMKKLYEKYNFLPGLELVKQEEERKEEERRKKEEKKKEDEKEREESYQKVVDFSKKNICTKVVFKKIHCYGEKVTDFAADVYDTDGNFIGHILPYREKVAVIPGDEHMYLINIERAKKIRGTLHIDIDKIDAGLVIGRKGRRIEETKKDLNDNLGCSIERINVHVK